MREFLGHGCLSLDSKWKRCSKVQAKILFENFYTQFCSSKLTALDLQRKLNDVCMIWAFLLYLRKYVKSNETILWSNIVFENYLWSITRETRNCQQKLWKTKMIKISSVLSRECPLLSTGSFGIMGLQKSLQLWLWLGYSATL